MLACVCFCVYIYVWMHACMYIYDTCMYPLNRRSHGVLNICMYICTHTHTHTQMVLLRRNDGSIVPTKHTHTHIHPHTYTHTYIHIHTQMVLLRRNDGSIVGTTAGTAEIRLRVAYPSSGLKNIHLFAPSPEPSEPSTSEYAYL